MRGTASFLLIVVWAGAAASAGGLAPGEVLVVANSASEDSLAVAHAYARSRGIAQENVLSIRMPAGEEVSPEEYDKLIRQPLLAAVGRRPGERPIRCLCLVYGVPLRIAGDLGPGATLATACRDYLKESRERLLRLLGGLREEGQGSDASADAAMEDLFRRLDAALSRRLAAAPKVRPAPGGLAQAQQELHGLRGLIDLQEHQRLEGAPDLETLRRQLRAAEEAPSGAARTKPGESVLRQTLAAMERTGGLQAATEYARGQLQSLRAAQPDASVDSELALLLWARYDVEGPLPNPLHWRGAGGASKDRPILMTSRIDGPSRGDALRMIKSSLASEAKGLRGRFYINAGGPHKDYDLHLRTLRDDLQRQTKMPVVFGQTLFAPQSCPEAALYVGWHSPQRYVPSMMWVPGAVAWHIAGGEARDLRDPQSPQWCPQMIRNGVAATLGAIGEPTLGAFPVPEDFFGLLLSGKLTVAECYWRTVGHVSWKMVLLADPLYNPFASNPQLDPDQLPKGLMP